MVLAIEELSALEDEIMSVLPDRITAILSKLNRSGRLEELLELLLSLIHILPKNGRICVCSTAFFVRRVDCLSLAAISSI